MWVSLSSSSSVRNRHINLQRSAQSFCRHNLPYTAMRSSLYFCAHQLSWTEIILFSSFQFSAVRRFTYYYCSYVLCVFFFITLHRFRIRFFRVHVYPRKTSERIRRISEYNVPSCGHDCTSAVRLQNCARSRPNGCHPQHRSSSLHRERRSSNVTHRYRWQGGYKEVLNGRANTICI